MRLACIEGEIIGFLAYDVEKAWVRQLFVAPAWQGKGVGAQLLEAAKEALPDGFWLRTEAGNTGARRFYLREGLTLQSEGPHPEHGRPTATYAWAGRDA